MTGRQRRIRKRSYPPGSHETPRGESSSGRLPIGRFRSADRHTGGAAWAASAFWVSSAFGVCRACRASAARVFAARNRAEAVPRGADGAADGVRRGGRHTRPTAGRRAGSQRDPHSRIVAVSSSEVFRILLQSYTFFRDCKIPATTDHRLQMMLKSQKRHVSASAHWRNGVAGSYISASVARTSSSKRSA